MKAIFPIIRPAFARLTCGLLLAAACPELRAQNAVLMKDGVVIQEWKIAAPLSASPAAQTKSGVALDPETVPELLAPEASLFEAAAEAERILSQWLSSPASQNGAAPVSSALTSHQALLSAQSGLMKDLRKKGLPAEILQRQQELIDRLNEAVALEKAIADDFRNGRPATADAVDGLRDLIALPATVPVTEPRLSFDRQAAPALTRSEVDKRLEIANGKTKPAKRESKRFTDDPQYRAETPEIKLTPAIRAKAAELGNDPLALANFVRNEVEFQPYLGSRKGAAFTFEQGAGNDTDQASLLIALMRAAGIPTRYAKATCEISAEAAASWLGVDSPAAAAGLLTTAGLDGVAINAPGGGVSRVGFTHTWVEAYLPFANYRGQGGDQSGRAWVRFSPSFTGSIVGPGLPTINIVNPDPDAFLQSFTSSTRTQLPLDALAAQLEATASASESAIAHTHEILPVELPLLPASLPMDVLGTVTYKSSLADQDRYKIRLALALGASQVLDLTSNLSDLTGANVRIDWSPATAADQSTIDGFGGLYSTPPNLVQLRPSLLVGGVVVAGPGTAVGMGRSLNFTMNFLSPAGASNVQPSIMNTIDAGNNQAVSFDTFLDQHPGFDSGNPGLGDLFDSFLHLTAHNYLQRVNDAFLRGERLLRVRSTQGVSEAIVGNQVAVGFVFGTPVSFEWEGLFVDADRRIVGPFSVDDDDSKTRRFMVLTGMEGSNLEDRVFSEGFDEEAVSTIRILQLASEAGIPVCTITSNIDAQCPGFSHPGSVRTAVNAALAIGNTITIPRDPLTVGGWKGTGYVDMEPSGAAGWIISGGINGSVSAPSGGATVRERWRIDLPPCDVVSITGEILYPSADPPASQAIFCADETRLTFRAFLLFTCDDGDLVSQFKALPFTNTTKSLGGGNYTINLLAFGAPQIIRRFTIVELKDLKVVDAAGPMNFVLATSGEVLTVPETPGMDSASIELDATAAPNLPENASYLLWKVEGDTAAPLTGNFATVPVPVKLDISSGNREFMVKAGCDDNQNGILGDAEVTYTVKVIVSCVELDIDANGDGSITDDDDDPTETSMGGLVCANIDDDNDDDVIDRDQTTVTNEDDLEPINIGFLSTPAPTSGTLKLEATSGAGRIKVWSAATKGTEITLPKTWTVGSDTIPPTLYVEGISGSDAARDVKLKLTYENGASMCEDEIALTVVELTVHNVHTMANIDASMTQTSEFVALQTRLRADIKPASASNAIKWTVGGDRIKTYEHDIDEPAEHQTIDLESADFGETEIGFFWTKTGMPHKVNLEVTPDGFTKKCNLEIEFEVKNDPDPGLAIYCNRGEDPAKIYTSERANPNGESEVYRLLTDHDNWHGGRKMTDETKDAPFSDSRAWGNGDRSYGTNYNGTAFLGWHREFLAAHAKWRSTFNLRAISGPAPGELELPEYLKTIPTEAGSTLLTQLQPAPFNETESRILSRSFGYARLGEFQNVNQLGIGTVHPWHNLGHWILEVQTGDGAMGNNDSPSTKDNTFWHWHGRIEAVHSSWRTNQADVSMTDPATNAAVAAPLTEVIVTFSRPVSCEVSLTPDQNTANTVKLRAGALRVAGSAATTVADVTPAGSRFRVYRFTGFAAPAGTFNIILTGTASFASRTWSVTVNP